MRCTAQMFLLSEDAIAVVLKVPGHGRKGGGLYSADFALAAVQNQQPPDGTCEKSRLQRTHQVH